LFVAATEAGVRRCACSSSRERISSVASVLAELVDSLDGGKLVHAAGLCPIAWTQRLGNLLDIAGHRDIADMLGPYVRGHAHVVAQLVRAKPASGVERVERWKLAVNATVEPTRDPEGLHHRVARARAP